MFVGPSGMTADTLPAAVPEPALSTVVIEPRLGLVPYSNVNAVGIPRGFTVPVKRTSGPACSRKLVVASGAAAPAVENATAAPHVCPAPASLRTHTR